MTNNFNYAIIILSKEKMRGKLKMDWKEKMALAMKLMKEACKENGDWTKCSECPFTEKCDLIMETPGHCFDAPDSWDIE